MSDFRSRRLAILALFGILTFGFTACDDDTSNPGIEPEIINETDAFQFQATAVRNYSNTLEYVWNNTGTEANVEQSTTITQGTLELVLLDATGAEVYSRNLAEDGSFQSSAGDAGDWTIRLIFDNMSGTVNFRAEKRTP